MSSSQQSQSKSYIRYTSSDGTIFRQRQGRLLSLLGFSSNGVVINENDMYTAVASFLALKHLEQRSGAVLSHLPELLEGCDFTWTIESRETQYSAMHAIRELVTATTPSLTTATTTTTTSSGSSSNGPASTSPFAILPISDTQSEDTASDTQSEDTNPTNTDTTTPEPATIPTSNAYWAIPEPEVQQNSTTSSSHNSYWTTAGPAATTTSQPTSSSNSIPLNLTIEPTTTPTPTTAPVDLLLQEDIPPRRTVPPSRPNLIGNNPPRTPRPIRTSVPVSTATTTTSGRGINQRMLLQDNDYWTTPAPASMETDASTTNSYWSTTSTATSTTTSTTTTSSSSSASEPAASPTTNHSEDANNGYWNINPEPSDANESSTTNENGNNSNTDNDYYWRTPEPQQAADEKPEEENANSYWTIPETTSDEAHVGENSYWALPEQQQSTESTTAATSTTSSPSHQHQQQQQEWQHPFAILGAVYSSVTIPLSILGGAYELPQISGSATSAALDTAPMFARTIPTNAGDARALMMYYRSIGVTHVACLYIKDPWGDYYNADLTREAFHRGIAYRSFAYTEDDIESSIARLANSGYKYIFAILFDWRPVIEAAYDYGIIGNAEYHWIGAEMVDWTGPTLQLSRHDPQDQKVAKALNGVGSLMLHVSEYAPLQKALQEFSEDEELQREFVESHPRADVRELLRFPQTQVNFYQHMFYDAVIALGLASCQTPGLFTGSELHKTMVNLQFEGVTGNVSFIAKTGGRSLESVSYRIDNVVLSDERSDDSFVRFQSNLAVMVSGENIQYQHPYIYADNSTMPPLALPPLEHNYNLMPIGVQVFGLLMAAGVILFSLAIIAWIVLKRNTFVVRASQPVFLAQLCLGTIIMASAVIPMSFQGKFPTSQLDTACMTIPWLTFLGFVLSFSALSSKSK